MNSSPSGVVVIPRLERIKIEMPVSASNSFTTAERFGWETNNFFAASFMDLESAMVMICCNC